MNGERSGAEERAQGLREHLSVRVEGPGAPRGSLTVSGAKNSAVVLLAAALLSDEKVTLSHFPTGIVDANYKAEFIRQVGGRVHFDHETETATVEGNEALRDLLLDSYDFPIRTTYLLVPGLLKHAGRARIPYPGGCAIGERKYDIHVMVWEAFGCRVSEEANHIDVQVERLRPARLDLPISTIGGTETALLCAAAVEGESTIRNAYISPEIEDLIHLLRQIGVEIEVAGNSFIRVVGQRRLRGTSFTVMPDRIEALTWIVLAAVSGGELVLRGVPFETMAVPLIHLREAGLDLYANSTNVFVSPECLQNGRIQPFELATGTHPGVISDMQPFFVLLGLHADGTSRIHDYRYPARVKYLEELSRFYPGQLAWEPGHITIHGRHEPKPVAAEAISTDLRGSMSLLMAATLASGVSRVHRADMALRGYNRVIDKLSILGLEARVEENA